MSHPLPELPKHGSLREIGLAELLVRCARQRFTGSVRLERGKLRKLLLLRNGAPTMVESNTPGESLCEHLLEAGKISRVDIKRIAQRMRIKRGSEANALIAEELTTPVEIYAALKTQVHKRLLDGFRWEEGSFAIEEADTPPEGATPLRTDPIAAIHEGITTHWSVEQLRDAFSDRLEHYANPSVLAPELLKRLPLEEGSIEQLAALDGSRRLGEALEDAAPAIWAAVWLLDRWGGLRYRREAQASQGEGEESAGTPRIEVVVGGTGSRQPPLHPGQSRGSRTTRDEVRPKVAAEEVRREILALHESLAERDHYELLNVDRNVEARAIKKAYFRLAKRYHPDALTRLHLDEIKEKAKVVFAQIATAYEVLSDPERRRSYDRPTPLDSDQDGDRALRAESLYRKASVLIRAGRFAAALPFLEPAVTLWPEEVSYQSDLGWALYKKSPSDPEAARPYLEKASRMAPHDEEVAQRLAVVLRSLGDERGAVQVLLQARKRRTAKAAG